MYRKILRCKIHRAVVTHADLDYEGSITLPPGLMQAAGLIENEAVAVWNITNGSRFETYVLNGEDSADQNEIAINGAAANITNPGDLVIIAAFNYLESDEIAGYEPKLIFVDEKNQIKDLRREVPGPKRMIAN